MKQARELRPKPLNSDTIRIFNAKLRFPLFIVALMAGLAVSVTYGTTTTEFSKLYFTEISLNHEIRSTLSPTSGAFIWVSDENSAVFETSHVFHFTAPSENVFSIQYQSDLRLLGMITIDGNGKVVAMPTTFLQVPRTNKSSVSLQKDQEIWIVLGAGKLVDPVAFRIGIFDNDNRIGPNRNREYSTATLGSKNYESVINIDKYSIPLKYFQLNRKNTADWVSITATSTNLRPYILVIDPTDSEITQDVFREDTNSSSHVVIGPNTNWSSFAVQQFRDDNSKSSNVNLDILEYPYDPHSTVVSAVSYYMSNPILSFLMGGALALLITYVFYRRTLNAKVIYVESQEDRAVVNRDNSNQPLLFGPDKETIHCASLCTIRISSGGYGHITRADVLNELVLKLGNVLRIVTFQYDMSPESWCAPVLSEQDASAFKLSFYSLSRGDYIRITALCEQDKLDNVLPIIRGRIKDTKFRSRTITSRSIVENIPPLIAGTIWGVVASAPIILVMSWWDIWNIWLASGLYLVSTWLIMTIALPTTRLWLPFIVGLVNFVLRRR